MLQNFKDRFKSSSSQSGANASESAAAKRKQFQYLLLIIITIFTVGILCIKAGMLIGNKGSNKDAVITSDSVDKSTGKF